MRQRHLIREYALFCIIIILGAVLLGGCLKGDKGDTGPAGPAGATGATGPAGPAGESAEVTATEETCGVCHGTGKIADIAVAHPDPTGADVTISNIVLTNAAGTATVSFHAATADAPVTGLTVQDVLFMIADLVPANTATAQGTWDSPYFERWAYEAGLGFEHTGITVPAAALVDNGGGDYTYTFTTSFANATAAAPDYNETHTQRLVIVVEGDGVTTNNTVGFLDFTTPAAGGAVTTEDSQRLFVTAEACTKCHGAPFQQAAHAPTYLDTRTCVVCHSPLGVYGSFMQSDNAYLPLLIHQIHGAIDNPVFEDQIRGLGFGAVKYPQSFTKTGGTAEIPTCTSCHTDSGLDLGTGNEIDNWMNHPSVEVCGSCHTTVNFATGENHDGGIQTNGTCTVCHPATGTGYGQSVASAHDTTPTGYNVPEYKVHLTITPPANDSYYVAGETPKVTVTLTDYTTDAAVDSSVYTTAQDNAGTSGGGLAVASLYVYGPRAKAVPVLATGTVTDPNFDSTTDTPTQSHSLFTGGTDTLVTTDATGFGYQLLAIPDGMTAGTYMVRVRFADYSRVSDSDYKIESTAFATIQIGTATESPKVAGDACMDCHGTRTAPFHDARHAVVFDTDQCLSCHDQSGNHAIPLANRVHAVHSTNSAGDLYNIEGSGSRDWSDITYPQNIQSPVTGEVTDDGMPRCVGCHTSTDTTYKTKPYMMPCVGCHAVSANGDIAHMRQNGGPF